MKICHVITRMIVGGAQENTLYTVRGHLEHGHDTTLVTGLTVGPEGKLLDKVRIPELRVIHLPALRRQINPYHDYQAYRQLKRLFRDGRYEIVHTHSSKAGVIGRIAAAHARVPVIAHTIHGPSFHPYQSRWLNRVYIGLERLAARHGHRSYTVADAMRDAYLQAGIGRREEYKTVYSGMELEPYLNAAKDQDLANQLGLNLAQPVVGKVARLFELKGYEYLMAAAPAILQAVPATQFLIVGDGNLQERLKRQVREMGMASRFIFAGLVEPPAIHRYTALMDILIHLSLREGLPRSVVQGLAAGKPAVGFALDGTPEVILDGRTGYLCPPRDATAVAAAVIRLLKNPEQAREMGANGRELVRTRWDWRTMVATLEDDYRQLLESRHS